MSHLRFITFLLGSKQGIVLRSAPVILCSWASLKYHCRHKFVEVSTRRFSDSYWPIGKCMNTPNGISFACRHSQRASWRWCVDRINRTEERLFFSKKVLSWRRCSILLRENFAFFAVIFLSMTKIVIADKETGFFINLRRFNISLPNSRKSSVAKKPPLQNHGISYLKQKPRPPGF